MATMNKKITKASKHRLMTFGTISIFIVAYFFLSLGMNMMRIKKLSDEQMNLENELVALKSKEENLKVEIQKLKDPDYVAKYARETYFYSKDGEYILKLKNGDQDVEAVVSNDNYLYYIYGTGITLVGVFIFILKRRR